MAVVAVPFILYLVRFCSSKSCNEVRVREYSIGSREYGSRDFAGRFGLYFSTRMTVVAVVVVVVTTS